MSFLSEFFVQCFIYRVPAYCNEGSFEEDAELCERTGGKAVLLKGSCILWRETVGTTCKLHTDKGKDMIKKGN